MSAERCEVCDRADCPTLTPMRRADGSLFDTAAEALEHIRTREPDLADCAAHRVDWSAEFGDHPAPCCWFGDDREPGANGRDLRVSVNGDDGSLRTSEGAIADGRCVAWLLTNREELLRLAKIGQGVEGDPGREGGER